YLNQAAEQLIGLSAPQALDHLLAELVSLVDESDRNPLADPVKQCLTTRTRVSVDRRGLMVARDGTGERSVELSVSPLRNHRGDVVGTVIAIRDVSELRGLTRQMSYQASHDALTGLINR